MAALKQGHQATFYKVQIPKSLLYYKHYIFVASAVFTTQFSLLILPFPLIARFSVNCINLQTGFPLFLIVKVQFVNHLLSSHWWKELLLSKILWLHLYEKVWSKFSLKKQKSMFLSTGVLRLPTRDCNSFIYRIT